MIKKTGLFISIIVLLHFSTTAQTEMVIKPVSKVELALIDFLNHDTINDLNLNLFDDQFKFGFNPKLVNGISLIKKGSTILIQPLGTGRLYQVIETYNHQFEFKRLDSTIHAGYNFGALNFNYKDTILQLGGMGIWQIKDHFSFFSPKTKEWEIYNSKQRMPVALNISNPILYHFNKTTSKLYLSSTIHYVDFPSSLSNYMKDSCQVFDFKTRIWSTLGKLNPSLKEILQKESNQKTNTGPYIVFDTDLELFWINFEQNAYGTFSRFKQEEYREKWLKLYHGKPVNGLRFMLGDAYYLLRIDIDGKLSYEKIPLAPSEFNNTKIGPVYINDWWYTMINKILPGKPILGNTLICIILILVYTFFKKRLNKNNIPKEVQSILYKNFYSSLTIVEKELIQCMCQLQTKNEQISIKQINKIIGVQQKDIITQNKSRSDYFLRINQKFKLATRETELLILKQRDSNDKRQYIYNINDVFYKQIEQLFLDNQ